jgi:hypothetical protein
MAGAGQMAQVQNLSAAGPASAGQATGGQAPQAGSPAQSATQVHHQVNQMLRDLGSGLANNHLLQMLVAGIILEAMNNAEGNDDNGGSSAAAAALVGASAGASLAALSHTASHFALSHASSHAIEPQRAVHTTPYAAQSQPLQQNAQGSVDMSV